MNRSTLRTVLTPALILALALPAVAATFRDRLVMSGTGADGTSITATVVDNGSGDLVSVNTSRSVSCVDADGNSDNIVTLKSISLPDVVVDVPELLRSVSASGTGTMTVTVIDRCSLFVPHNSSARSVRVDLRYPDVDAGERRHTVLPRAPL